MRCRPLATDGGASICTTRSIAPMSMPSSSDEVATSARSAPAFSRSSTSTRCGRAIEPWCERTSVSPASSFSAPASRSASRRLLTKISVDRCARISSSSRGWIAAQIDGRARRRPTPGRSGSSSARRRACAMSSTGHFDRQLQRLLLPGVDDGDRPVADDAVWTANSLFDLAVDLLLGRAARRAGIRAPAARSGPRRDCVSAPPRNRATSSSGRCVADRPMRCGGLVHRSLRAARATAPGARRAWSAPARGSRR